MDNLVLKAVTLIARMEDNLRPNHRLGDEMLCFRKAVWQEMEKTDMDAATTCRVRQIVFNR